MLTELMAGQWPADIVRRNRQPLRVGYAYNLSTREVEAGGSHKFKVSLGYRVRLCLKKIKQTNKTEKRGKQKPWPFCWKRLVVFSRRAANLSLLSSYFSFSDMNRREDKTQNVGNHKPNASMASTCDPPGRACCREPIG